MSGVKTEHPRLMELKPIYKMIRDVLSGPAAIKKAGTTYLPNPDPLDDSEYGVARYQNYLERAIFFEATYRTHEAFVGQVFYRETQIEVPEQLEVVVSNADGQGVGLIQQSKNAVGEVLALGRGGLYTDYTKAPGGEGATLADQQSGAIRPIITFYPAENIKNWRHSVIDNQKVLSMVTLLEQYESDDDGFALEVKDQYRELRLDPVTGNLFCQIWRDGNRFGDPTFPTMGNGQSWKRIPFEFIGSRDNDPAPDKPPMEGMAHVNIGHYRNSADYEEMVFISGQPTPFASGITEVWMQEHWKGEIHLGSREFIPLPANGTLGMLQMETTTIAKEAMDQKEDQLVALGAKLIESKSVATTATEENRDSVMENSVLSSVAKNVSEAYANSLKHACSYEGLPSDKIVFEINTDFEMTRLSSQDRTTLLAELQGGGITWEEYRWNLKRGGVAYEDDKVAKRKIDAEMADAIDLDPPAPKDPPAEE